MGALAGHVWSEILEDTGRTAAQSAGELMTNGDFETDLPNAGLDWRLTEGAGYRITLDDFGPRQGSRSLRVVFDGSKNLDFQALSQFVPVEANREYRFRGYLKTENITTDNGLRFCVQSYAAPAKESFVRCGEGQIGDHPWSLEQIEFTTGPNTNVVLVSLNRQRSPKLNNLLQGKVWIDAVSIRPR